MDFLCDRQWLPKRKPVSDFSDYPFLLRYTFSCHGYFALQKNVWPGGHLFFIIFFYACMCKRGSNGFKRDCHCESWSYLCPDSHFSQYPV